MTTQVTIECTRCGTTQAVPVDALLVALADDLADGGPGGDDAPAVTADPDLAARVAWLCSECADLAEIPVDWTGLLLLITEGATFLAADEEQDELPPHPEAPAAGPGFTADDLLDLHELLAGDSWFDALTASGSRP